MPKVLVSPAAIARRVRQLGRQISRDYAGQKLDVVALLENGYIFVADLVRALTVPVHTHFIRADVRDIQDPATGKPRKEIFYTPDLDAEGRNILVVDGVFQSGITTDFFLRRISLHNPRSVRTAVFVDKPADRKVLLEPDYYAFRITSNDMVVGYGLSWDGQNGNLPYLASWGRPKAKPARGSARAARPRVKVKAKRRARK